MGKKFNEAKRIVEWVERAKSEYNRKHDAYENKYYFDDISDVYPELFERQAFLHICNIHFKRWILKIRTEYYDMTEEELPFEGELKQQLQRLNTVIKHYEKED